jgi:hypothetical protein
MAVCGGSLASLAWAQPVPAESAQRPLWELGVVGLGVSQQAYPGSDTRINRGLVLPYAIYRGRWLRADQDGAGLRAYRTPRWELDVGLAGSFGSRADEVPARAGMPKLGTLIEAGPRLTWRLHDEQQTVLGGQWRLQLPLRGVFDLSDGLAHRGMSFEPELQFRRRAQAGWTYSVSASAIIADKRLAQTFYGVDAGDALADRPAYDAQAGLVGWRLSTSASRALSPQWRVFGFVRLDSVAGAANRDSPLVRQTTGSSAGLGLIWTWKQSRQAGVD